MSEPIKRGATYADLMELPENVVGEIIGGDLFASPRPRLGHARLQLVLGGRVQSAFGERGGGAHADGWWLLSEPELRFGSDTLVPDIAGWRRTRMPELPAEAPWATLAPDWVCEVLSPGTARLDRVRKLPLFAREGVGHAWLVDPAARTLEVYRLESGLWVVAAVHGGDERVRPEPFAAAEFDLADWWTG